MSKLEEDLASQLDAEGIAYEREVCVIPGRKFRFDFRFKDRCSCLWLLEVQGGIWGRGGHSTGSGITRDMEKFDLATLEGYKVLLVGAKEIRSGLALEYIKRAIG